MFTTGLQEYNAEKAACIIEDREMPTSNVFEVPDETPLEDFRPIYLDVVSMRNTRRSGPFINSIRAFNRGKFERVLDCINKFRGRDMYVKLLFKIIHGIIRAYGTEKFGDQNLTLDYYVYRLMELALSDRETERAMKKITLHIVNLLKTSIELNGGETYVNKQFIRDNLYETENSGKLKVALMKIGVPSDSIVRKLTFDSAATVRVADSDIYNKAVIVMSILYSMPGTGWAKKFVDVNLRDSALMFGNRIGEPIESLQTKLRGYSILEKYFVVNKILKAAFLSYILTGNRVNSRGLNVLYRDEKSPFKWRIVNTFSIDMFADVSENASTLEYIDFMDSTAGIVDSTMRLAGITYDTYRRFASEYVTRFRMWREFLDISDTINALDTIDAGYVQEIKERVVSLITETMTMQLTT